MNTAVADDLIAANPCRVRGAGQSRRVKKIVPATLAELAALTKAMPGKYQLLVFSPRGAACALANSPNCAAWMWTSPTA
jgi:hypothetical protein